MFIFLHVLNNIEVKATHKGATVEIWSDVISLEKWTICVFEKMIGAFYLCVVFSYTLSVYELEIEVTTAEFRSRSK